MTDIPQTSGDVFRVPMHGAIELQRRADLVGFSFEDYVAGTIESGMFLAELVVHNRGLGITTDIFFGDPDDPEAAFESYPIDFAECSFSYKPSEAGSDTDLSSEYHLGDEANDELRRLAFSADISPTALINWMFNLRYVIDGAIFEKLQVLVTDGDECTILGYGEDSNE